MSADDRPRRDVEDQRFRFDAAAFSALIDALAQLDGAPPWWPWTGPWGSGPAQRAERRRAAVIAEAVRLRCAAGRS